MNIKNILINNGYHKETEKINPKILEMETGNCTQIRKIPNTICKLFDGFELYNEDDPSKQITINLEYFDGEDEFLPLYVEYRGADGYNSVEIFYDADLEVVYVNDLR